MSDDSIDWHTWHSPYDRPGSSLAVRLALVQSHIRQALDSAPPGEIRVVSLCAGQGRDLLGVLSNHSRTGDVTARLVELDERNVEDARASAEALGLSAQVEVVCGDASLTDSYGSFAPAHLVIACGIFGNISDDDVHRVVTYLPGLCGEGATVVWTRHRRPPDLTSIIRGWLGEVGFEQLGFDGPSHLGYVGVGANRWPGPAGVLEPGVQLFEWIGDSLPSS